MDFLEIMKQRSDKQIVEILTIKRGDYQEQAIIAAQAELEARNLDINDFISADDIKKIETDKVIVLIEKKDQKLELSYKILAFFLPLIVLKLGSFIFNNFFYAPPFSYLSLPIIMIFQYYIFKTLRKNGFDNKAKDFRNWSIAYYVLITVLIIIFVMDGAL